MYGYGKKKTGGMKKTGMKKMAGSAKKSYAKPTRKPAKRKTTSKSRKK